MTKITALIKPFLLDEVVNALVDIAVPGLTVSEVNGFGHAKGHTELYRGSEYVVSSLPRVKLELVVPDEMAEAVMSQIARHAHTGRIGDGKIWRQEAAHVVSIRTGAVEAPLFSRSRKR